MRGETERRLCKENDLEKKNWLKLFLRIPGLQPKAWLTDALTNDATFSGSFVLN